MTGNKIVFDEIVKFTLLAMTLISTLISFRSDFISNVYSMKSVCPVGLSYLIVVSNIVWGTVCDALCTFMFVCQCARCYGWCGSGRIGLFLCALVVVCFVNFCERWWICLWDNFILGGFFIIRLNLFLNLSDLNNY